MFLEGKTKAAIAEFFGVSASAIAEMIERRLR